MAHPRYTRDRMAALVARDIPEGSYVNLGIGMPTLVGNHLGAGREVVLHSENGLLGMGPPPAPQDEDPDFHHADSFAMIRGGHLDICVLGAFQVSVAGDLANWHTGAPDAIPAVGGAMDLAAGANRVLVMMEHLTKAGESKIVERLSCPVTALACVDRIYTDLAVIDVTPHGLAVREIVDGVSLGELRRLTGVPLSDGRASA